MGIGTLSAQSIAEDLQGVLGFAPGTIEGWHMTTLSPSLRRQP